ncbi:MAG: class I SAM-dependent methyltransferase [Gemmataceae bacterium]|nr:class I SAM-dependent methyltransferase [Gemmataceae bacterium]
MKFLRCLPWFITLPLLLEGPGRSADPPAKQKPRYEYNNDHDEDGIGKFYMGREIAHVMGHQAIGWLERPEREKEEAPTKMIEALKLQPGDVVADIGCGSGYHTERISEKVGAKGKVYGVDIQPEMLAALKKRMRVKNITNVEAIRSTEEDPKLPADKVDLILMVDVYHEFSHPYEMTQKMVEALKPGGRLVFIEFRLEDKKVPIKTLHKMSEAQVKREMEPHPLRFVENIGGLPWQHILIFKKKMTKD